MTLAPFRLLPRFREKLWGSTELEPWFGRPRRKIGEVWFTLDEEQSGLIRDHGPELLGHDWQGSEFPILVKFIFTSAPLSIQVHPDDERARAWENSPGKTEMWHLLRAAPGASIALGFNRSQTRERLREAALSGEIEALLRWFPVRPGETFFAPAGTVHAIGAGVALCEIQQNSDVTYRLYDYGRPRELHLDKAVAVASPEPHPGPSTPIELAEGKCLLACCPYFRTESWELAGAEPYRPDPGRVHILILLEGEGALGGRPCRAGDVWIVPACAAPFTIEGRARLLRTFVPPAG